MQVDGGNAVDAAVATALCQGVMSPAASGIGGGAFLVVRLPNGTAEAIDAREVAPAAANETMFQGEHLLAAQIDIILHACCTVCLGGQN